MILCLIHAGSGIEVPVVGLTLAEFFCSVIIWCLLKAFELVDVDVILLFIGTAALRPFSTSGKQQRSCPFDTSKGLAGMKSKNESQI